MSSVVVHELHTGGGGNIEHCIYICLPTKSIRMHLDFSQLLVMT